MGNYILILRELIRLLTAASILIVTTVTVLKIIRRAGFYSGKTGVLMAVSLSLLFLVALSEALVFPALGSGNEVNATVGYFYLLPWVALAVAAAVVLSQVMLLASRTSPNEKPSASDGKTDAKESEYSLAKPKSRGRPKKKERKPSEIKTKEATESAGSSS